MVAVTICKLCSQWFLNTLHLYCSIPCSVWREFILGTTWGWSYK